jgi:tetratricopeptide (TPR) repeat protein
MEFAMIKLRKWTLYLLIVLLFVGCQTGVPVRTQVEPEGIETAFVAAKWDDVVALGEKRVEKEPENAVVHFVMSMAYYMKGDYDLQERERSLALEDEENADSIVAWCEQLTQRFPDNYYAYLLLGSAYRAKDEVNKAMESYQRAVQISPNLPDAYLGLAATYFMSEKADEAIKYFKKAIELNPKHVAAYYNLGSLYANTSQIDEAITSFEKTVEIDPNFKEAYMNLGDLYLEKGDKEKAIKAYQKVIELDPQGELGSFAREAIEGIENPPSEDTEKKP